MLQKGYLKKKNVQLINYLHDYVQNNILSETLGRINDKETE